MDSKVDRSPQVDASGVFRRPRVVLKPAHLARLNEWAGTRGLPT